jgi:hypothetical protein
MARGILGGCGVRGTGKDILPRCGVDLV